MTMSMIAFNFTGMHAERRAGRVQKYSIKNNTSITDVKEQPLGKQKALLFVFSNKTTYEPGIGEITLTGDVLFLASEEEAKTAVEQFAKAKKVDAKWSEPVYNIILGRTTVQTLVLARDIGLPAPIQMPRVRPASAASGAGTGSAPAADGAKTGAPAKAASPAPKRK
jgi:hypothetical protein